MLVVSLEELLGMPTKQNKRGPTPKLQRQIELISQLPKPKQRFVMEILDTVIQQAQWTTKLPAAKNKSSTGKLGLGMVFFFYFKQDISWAQKSCPPWL